MEDIVTKDALQFAGGGFVVHEGVHFKILVKTPNIHIRGTDGSKDAIYHHEFAVVEAFLIDDEMLSYVYRILRGVEVNEETLGFEAILEAVTGEGHFLGGTHTMAAMERDYYYPELANRETPRVWGDGGAPDVRGNRRWPR